MQKPPNERRPLPEPPKEMADIKLSGSGPNGSYDLKAIDNYN